MNLAREMVGRGSAVGGKDWRANNREGDSKICAGGLEGSFVNSSFQISGENISFCYTRQIKY